MSTEKNDPLDAEFTVTDREVREARLTAYALGDVDEGERADVDRVLADPAATDVRLHVDEMSRLAAALKTSATAAEVARSPDLRRAILAAATGSPRVVVSPGPRQASPHRPWRMLAALTSLAAVVAVTATVLFSHKDERQLAMRNRVKKSLEEASAPAMQVAEAPAAAPVPVAAPVTAPSAEPSPAAEAAPRARVAAPAMAAVERAPAAAARPMQPDSRVAVDADTLRREILGPGRPEFPASGEGYATFAENRFLAARERPLSTFSIDVDTASYANVRRFLASGRRPPRDAVRIEELVNYFRYDYPQPDDDVPFAVTVDAAECPWRAGHRLVRIGLQGKDIDRGARPAGNLVFLVDVSGSMQAANKLPLVKQALAMLVEELTENDRVSIVTYAGNAGLVLPPTTGDQKKNILAAIESLTPGGSTHGSAGIALAYEQAREHFIAGGSNRVILATDGDLNVGVTSTAALIDLIKEKAAGGTFLTVLGFGEGNLQDEKMEALADNGNGVYAYIDGVREARKVLVEQLTGSTVTIAKDVKIQVEFNPAQVASYRLLGYENRALAARDFRDDKKDAGEIGAGHSVTALYEVALVGEEATSGGGAEPLKYQLQPEVTEPAIAPDASRELLTLKLRWKRPDGDTSTLLEVPLADRGGAFDEAPADLRFAAAVAAFGMILRDSSERGDATLPLVAKIAGTALGRDEGGYRAEFLDLVRRAEAVR